MELAHGIGLVDPVHLHSMIQGLFPLLADDVNPFLSSAANLLGCGDGQQITSLIEPSPPNVHSPMPLNAHSPTPLNPPLMPAPFLESPKATAPQSNYNSATGSPLRLKLPIGSKADAKPISPVLTGSQLSVETSGQVPQHPSAISQPLFNSTVLGEGSKTHSSTRPTAEQLPPATSQDTQFAGPKQPMTLSSKRNNAKREGTAHSRQTIPAHGGSSSTDIAIWIDVLTNPNICPRPRIFPNVLISGPVTLKSLFRAIHALQDTDALRMLVSECTPRNNFMVATSRYPRGMRELDFDSPNHGYQEVCSLDGAMQHGFVLREAIASEEVSLLKNVYEVRDGTPLYVIYIFNKIVPQVRIQTPFYAKPI